MRLKQSWTAVSETFEGTKFGRYILLDEIGSGGMAKIYRAKTFGAAGFEKEFALKLILPSLVDDAEFVDMFINEAKIVVNLYHANIVQVFDLGEIDGQYYIAMEYVSGQDLLDILARCAKENIKIPLDLGLFMVMETLKGLNFAHNASDPYGNPLNIIHRDVTPSNVMISYGGDVKIGDFGVAQAAREKKVDPNDGPLKGKVEYMSPEQVTGNGVDARSDIFSAGIVLFEVLTQSRLFVGNSDLEVMMKVRDAEVDKRFEESSDIPPSLEKIARKALAKEPEDRFETASEFYQALVDFCYRHDIHIRDRDLSNFMQRLFSDEIEAEKQRREDEPEILEQLTEESDELKEQLFERGDGESDHQDSNDDKDTDKQRDDLETTKSSDSKYSPNDSDDGRENEPKQESLKSLKGQYASYEGSIADTPFARILVRLHYTRTTGRLEVKRGETEKSIYFDEGEPILVESNKEDELLGSYLLSEGIITQEELDEALARLHEWGGRLGDALIATGAVPARDIFKRLTEQMEQKLLDIFTWAEGTYGYYENQEPDTVGYPLGLNTYTLVVRGCRQHVPLDIIQDYYRSRKDVSIRIEADSKADIDRFNLRPDELRILETHEANMSLKDLEDSLPDADRETMYRTVYLLHQVGVFRFEATSPVELPPLD